MQVHLRTHTRPRTGRRDQDWSETILTLAVSGAASQSCCSPGREVAFSDLSKTALAFGSSKPGVVCGAFGEALNVDLGDGH